MIGKFNDLSNLKVLYHLDGVLTDSSANGYTLTNSGSTSDSAAGRFSNGRLFSGGYLYNASYTNLGTTQVFTVAMWVYCTSVSASRALICKNDGGTRNFTTSVETSSKIFFSNRVAGADVLSNGTVTLNAWNFIVCTRDTASSGTNKIYINGRLDKTQTGCGDNGAPTGNFCIGSSAYSPPSSVFAGTLDELAIYTRVFTETEIRKWYAWCTGRYL